MKDKLFKCLEVLGQDICLKELQDNFDLEVLNKWIKQFKGYDNVLVSILENLRVIYFLKR